MWTVFSLFFVCVCAPPSSGWSWGMPHISLLSEEKNKNTSCWKRVKVILLFNGIHVENMPTNAQWNKNVPFKAATLVSCISRMCKAHTFPAEMFTVYMPNSNCSPICIGCPYYYWTQCPCHLQFTPAVPARQPLVDETVERGATYERHLQCGPCRSES